MALIIENQKILEFLELVGRLKVFSFTTIVKLFS